MMERFQHYLFPPKKVDSQFTKLPAELNALILNFVPEKTLQILKHTSCPALSLAAMNRQVELDNNFRFLTKLATELDSSEDVIYLLSRLKNFIETTTSDNMSKLIDDSMNLILQMMLFLTKKSIIKFIYKIEFKETYFCYIFPDIKQINIPLHKTHLVTVDRDVRKMISTNANFLLCKHNLLDKIISLSYVENSFRLAWDDEGQLKNIFDLLRQTLSSIKHQLPTEVNQNAAHRLGQA